MQIVSVLRVIGGPGRPCELTSRAGGEKLRRPIYVPNRPCYIYEGGRVHAPEIVLTICMNNDVWKLVGGGGASLGSFYRDFGPGDGLSGVLFRLGDVLRGCGAEFWSERKYRFV